MMHHLLNPIIDASIKFRTIMIFLALGYNFNIILEIQHTLRLPEQNKR